MCPSRVRLDDTRRHAPTGGSPGCRRFPEIFSAKLQAVSTNLASHGAGALTGVDRIARTQAAAPSPARGVPATAASLPEPDENGELPFTLRKSPQGFGISFDYRGMIVGCSPGSPAEKAGVPIGTLLVRVNGDPVLGKAQVIGAIKAAGAAQVMTFGFMTAVAFKERKRLWASSNDLPC